MKTYETAMSERSDPYKEDGIPYEGGQLPAGTYYRLRPMVLRYSFHARQDIGVRDYVHTVPTACH